MTILITGCAGFIGMHIANNLLARGEDVCGVDSLNEYYDPALKMARLDNLKHFKKFTFNKCDITIEDELNKVFQECRPSAVINLAGQPGVRYSITNPGAYIQSNVVGFGNVLEACRQHSVGHLIYASSSSVYGANADIPWGTNSSSDFPLSLYAATKKSNELMAHAYSHLFNLRVTGLRYFTVYGPWGRPDMSPWLFTSAIAEGRAINIFNNGAMTRDFTYIDDIANATTCVLDGSPELRGNYALYNVGSDRPFPLLAFIEEIEKNLGIVAIKKYLPMQAGDLKETWADISDLKKDFGFSPKVSLEEGVRRWVEWYSEYKS